MTAQVSVPEPRRELQRQIRLVSILSTAYTAGLGPLTGAAIHGLAYMCDVMAPVWDLPLLDGQVLKTPTRPNFPALQRDLDRLVGCGMVLVLAPDNGSSGSTGLKKEIARYRLTPLADPVLAAIKSQHSQALLLRFVREVVLAASALGATGVGQLGEVDVAYSDPSVDAGTVLNLDGEFGPNLSAATAFRFNELDTALPLTDTQLVHLYVRHIFQGIRVA